MLVEPSPLFVVVAENVPMIELPEVESEIVGAFAVRSGIAVTFAGQLNGCERLPEVTVTVPVLVPTLAYVLETVLVVPESPSVPLHE